MAITPKPQAAVISLATEKAKRQRGELRAMVSDICYSAGELIQVEQDSAYFIRAGEVAMRARTDSTDPSFVTIDCFDSGQIFNEQAFLGGGEETGLQPSYVAVTDVTLTELPCHEFGLEAKRQSLEDASPKMQQYFELLRRTMMGSVRRLPALRGHIKKLQQELALRQPEEAPTKSRRSPEELVGEIARLRQDLETNGTNFSVLEMQMSTQTRVLAAAEYDLQRARNEVVQEQTENAKVRSEAAQQLDELTQLRAERARLLRMNEELTLIGWKHTIAAVSSHAKWVESSILASERYEEMNLMSTHLLTVANKVLARSGCLELTMQQFLTLYTSDTETLENRDEIELDESALDRLEELISQPKPKLVAARVTQAHDLEAAPMTVQSLTAFAADELPTVIIRDEAPMEPRGRLETIPQISSEDLIMPVSLEPTSVARSGHALQGLFAEAHQVIRAVALPTTSREPETEEGIPESCLDEEDEGRPTMVGLQPDSTLFSQDVPRSSESAPDPRRTEKGIAPPPVVVELRKRWEARSKKLAFGLYLKHPNEVLSEGCFFITRIVGAAKYSSRYKI